MHCLHCLHCVAGGASPPPPLGLPFDVGNSQVITRLEELGETCRDRMKVLAEVKSMHGDLFELTGKLIAEYGHGVPPVADDSCGLRISLTFRCVTHSQVYPQLGYYKGPDGEAVKIAGAPAVAAVTLLIAQMSRIGLDQQKSWPRLAT